MSLIKEIAEQAVDNVFHRGILLPTHRSRLIAEIEQALRAERERAAKIAKDHNSLHSSGCYHQDSYYQNCGLAIAEKIESEP